MTPTQHPSRTSPAATAPTPAAPPLWRRMVTMHLWSQLTVAAWLLGTAVVFVPIVLGLVSRVVEPSLSAVNISLSIALWFPFGVAIMLVVGYLRAVVAAGGTRRAFTVGGLVAAPVIGLCYSLGFTALLLVEDWAYSRLGWTPGAGTPGGTGPLSEGLWPQLGGSALAITFSTTVGLLVGAAYLRWGAWATLLLPVLVILPMAVLGSTLAGPRLIVVSGDATSGSFPDLQGSAVGLVLCLVTLAAVAAATWWILRRAPIRPAA